MTVSCRTVFISTQPRRIQRMLHGVAHQCCLTPVVVFIYADAIYFVLNAKLLSVA